MGGLFTDCLDHLREIGAQPCLFWLAESRTHAGDEQSGHCVPLGRVHGGGMNFHQYFILPGSRFFNIV